MARGKTLLRLLLLFGFLFGSTGFGAEAKLLSKPFLLAQAPDGELEEMDLDITIPENIGSTEANKEGGKRKNSQFQGKFYSWVANGLKNEDQQALYFNYNRLQLTLTELYGDISFYLKLNGRYNTLHNNDEDGYGRGENLRLDLSEAYINYEKQPGPLLRQFNFLAGIQTINWGKADEMRPTDIISPQDMTLFMLEGKNDRKLGRFALRSLFTFSEAFRVDVIWLPVQRATEMSVDSHSLFTPAAMTMMRDNGKTINPLKMPEQKLSHSDLALKGYFQLFGIDLSFSFYNGYDAMPYAEVTTDVTPILSRVTMWGFDFEKAVGSIVIRGEAAYFSKGQLFGVDQDQYPTLYAREGSDGTVEKEYFEGTLGFDKNDFLVQKMYLNLQYNMNFIRDFEGGLTNRFGTKQEETNHLALWDIYYEWDNLTYRLEFAGSYSFTHGDYLLKPSFHVKLGLETKMILGAYLFGGEGQTDMGQFKEKSFSYLQLEHLF